MTIGEKIIKECTLSVNEAETVYHSIQELHDKGVWHIPLWATELAEHFQVKSCAEPCIMFSAWRSVAMAYRHGCTLP